MAAFPEIPSQQQEELEHFLYERASRMEPKQLEYVERVLPKKLSALLGKYAVLPEKLRIFVDRVQLFFKMVQDKEFHLRWFSKALILAALLYFINPFDMFPDVLPIIGYIDDAFLIAVVANTLNSEIERYARFRNLPLETLERD